MAAGVAGLLVSAAPDLTPEDLRSALVRAAAPLPRAAGAAIVRPRSLCHRAHLLLHSEMAELP